MADPETPRGATTGGRRSRPERRRRVDLLVALAVALPTVVALAVVAIGQPSKEAATGNPPGSALLDSATLVCPGAAAASGPVRVTRAPGAAGGELSLRRSDIASDTLTAATDLDAAADSSVVVDDSVGPVVLEGNGAAAPGIVAGRDRGSAVPECRAPSYDEWLVGLGASARQATTLELVNPDQGDAVVDITLHGPDGIQEAPGLKGMLVRGESVRRVDLAQEVPSKDVLAAHLRVTRGRVSASALSTRDQLGTGRVSAEHLPTQSTLSTENLLLGIPERTGSATLVLVNPGEDEVRADLKLATAEAAFAPEQAEQVIIGPGAVRTVNMRGLLKDAVAEGAVGVQVSSTGPLGASLRLSARRDLVLLAPAIALTEPTATVLPAGARTLVLGDAPATGSVSVRAFDATGTQVLDELVEIGPGQAPTRQVPDRAVVLIVEPRNTTVAGVLTSVTKDGVASLRLRPADLRARVPDVRPRS